MSDLTLPSVRVAGAGDMSATGPELFDVYIVDGRIASVAPAARPDLDEGHLVAPGLVDLQVNGGWGTDLTENPESVWEVAEQMATIGVTAWLPTVISSEPLTRRRAAAALACGPPGGWDRWWGAIPLGWHFEGPYLNPVMRGAHGLEQIRPFPDPLAAGNLEAEALPRLITVAPEQHGSKTAIAALAEAGVVVSIGHTAADAATVGRAAEVGATMATHLFNAMTGIDHHEPGTVVGVLNNRMWFGLIADGHHVDPEVLRLLWSIAPDRIVLVSDAVAAVGLPDGASTLAGQPVTIAEGTVRLPDGTLAGSACTLIEAVRRFARWVGCTTAEALTLATAHPSAVLGEADRGRLVPGARADLIVLDANDELVSTVIGGRGYDR